MGYVSGTKTVGASFGYDDKIHSLEPPVLPAEAESFADMAFDSIAADGVAALAAHREAEPGVFQIVVKPKYNKPPGVLFQPAVIDAAEFDWPPEMKVLWKRKISHGGWPKRPAFSCPSAAGG